MKIISRTSFITLLLFSAASIFATVSAKRLKTTGMLRTTNSTVNIPNNQPHFSTAGFFALAQSDRTVMSFNPAWRFHKGDAKGAYKTDFDDLDWSVVSLPNGIEYLPLEASGCMNYQGIVWYRKHFIPSEEMLDKQVVLHFEAIMGKSKIYVNGQLVTSHLGGYLPIHIDITNYIVHGKDNVVAVLADNTNDTMYPPGKKQEYLDYSYFGGIYRDCWLILHNHTYITDPNSAETVAGGGVFVSYHDVSVQKATIQVGVQVQNDTHRTFRGTVDLRLIPICKQTKKAVSHSNHSLTISSNHKKTATTQLTVSKPNLWTPDHPNLYYLEIRIKNQNGQVIDGYKKRIGIHSFAFKGNKGFYLNGKPYTQKLMGVNKHQDYAVLGNALPNSIHWRDAKKLRDAGCRVIRNAHEPQDPAFLDACDELGLLVINNTPGWQFWNPNPLFEERVYSDLRNLVRRDRNHPCIWFWEPILNETHYPKLFAKRVHDIVSEEYPYEGCESACDNEAIGHEYYKIQYMHPEVDEHYQVHNDYEKPDITYFTREWGDNVDDWKAHNSPSRAARNWGEAPMTTQCHHYAHAPYPYDSYNEFYKTTPQLMGGCLWHAFDHQRGYHPDPFYGGLMDVFRQPKLAYYMFMAQRPNTNKDRLYQTGPMVHIANYMTPFSSENVDVYSNCDEVYLKFNKNGQVHIFKKNQKKEGMPSPIITFKNIFHFMKTKELDRKNQKDDIYLVAKGLINNQVVATDTVRPAFRPSKILLWADNEGQTLKADGSDVVTVIAAVADEYGTIKRLNNYSIRFSVTGEGHILGDVKQQLNPELVRWGTAPVLIQSTLHPGKITIKAEVAYPGIQMPLPAELTIHSVVPDQALYYDIRENQAKGKQQLTEVQQIPGYTQVNSTESYIKIQQQLDHVGEQQAQFGRNMKKK